LNNRACEDGVRGFAIDQLALAGRGRVDGFCAEAWVIGCGNDIGSDCGGGDGREACGVCCL
jgi:hypothetical protein